MLAYHFMHSLLDSIIHRVGVGLAIALNTNRIFMMNPDGPLKTEERDNTWHVKNQYCQELVSIRI